MNVMRVMVVGLLIVGGAAALHVTRAQPAPAGIGRTELLQSSLVPGHKVRQVRVDFEPGAAFGRHTHPGDELAYVLEGTLEYEVEGKPPIRLNAGDVLFIPAGTVHAARNVGSGKAKELATYVVEDGKPLVVLAK